VEEVTIGTLRRSWRSGRGFCDAIWKDQLPSTGELPIVRELPATPIDVFLVVTLGENCERNYLSWFTRSVEPAVG
jgi:hypothetical protein